MAQLRGSFFSRFISKPELGFRVVTGRKGGSHSSLLLFFKFLSLQLVDYVLVVDYIINFNFFFHLYVQCLHIGTSQVK